MAEANSWNSLRNHGLLSTTALLDLFEINGEARHSLESAHRPKSVEIRHPKYGTAVIRDQKPMRESALKKCLIGMTPTEWYETLNGQVFFWPTKERVQNLLTARAYRGRKHTILCIDTARLVAKYAAQIRLSPINSGSTIYNPQPRGVDTFRKMSDYPFEERRKLRGWANAVAELAVHYAVPDISELVVSVEHRRGDNVLEIIHPAPLIRPSRQA
jgi:hypothetical protein